MKEHIEKAAMLIEHVRESVRHGNRAYSSDIAGELEAAGLLVTDLHKRALNVAEMYRMGGVAFDPHGCLPREAVIALNELDSIGMASLAAKQPPKPRWEVRTGDWFTHVVDTRTQDRIGFSGTSAEAVAVAIALNALEPKP